MNWWRTLDINNSVIDNPITDGPIGGDDDGVLISGDGGDSPITGTVVVAVGGTVLSIGVATVPVARATVAGGPSTNSDKFVTSVRAGAGPDDEASCCCCCCCACCCCCCCDSGTG